MKDDLGKVFKCQIIYKYCIRRVQYNFLEQASESQKEVCFWFDVVLCFGAILLCSEITPGIENPKVWRSDLGGIHESKYFTCCIISPTRKGILLILFSTPHSMWIVQGQLEGNHGSSVKVRDKIHVV